MAHTPGPWRFVGPEQTGIRNGRQIVSDHPTLGPVTIIYAGTDAPLITEPDARLIAAAPELLEAVIELLSYPSGQYGESPKDDYDGACERAYAAIRKATGEA